MRNIVSLVVAVLALAMIGGCNDMTKTLHVYMWSDYISPEVVMQFESQNSCKVVIDTFDSNESMYTKLKMGGSGYDIVMPSSYQVEQLVKDKIVDRIDKSKVKNVIDNFDHSFDSQILDRDLTYSIPYAVTYTGIMYMKSKIPDNVDVKTWNVMKNPAFKGKITLLDDIRDTIGIGLMSLGYSLNSTNKDEIAAAAKYVVDRIKPNARKFDAESYKLEVSSGSVWIGHGYSSDAIQIIVGEDGNSRDDIGFVLPKEGFTIAWDELCIMSNSKQKDLAYKFIDFLFDADIALSNMQYICAAMANKPAIDSLPSNVRKIIVLSEEDVKNGQVLKSVSQYDGVLEMYNRAWDTVKSTEN